MKRVVQSVDKRKHYNNTTAPTALGIQSIIIGSPDSRQPEDIKSQNEETKAFKAHAQDFSGNRIIIYANYVKYNPWLT